MANMKIDRFGWLVAVASLGVLAGVGFKAPGDKSGVVDVERIVRECNYSKQVNEQLQGLLQARSGMLEFVSTYRVMKLEDAQKFRDLSLKPTPTPQEQKELERIKADAIAADARYRELSTKANPAAPEVEQLNEFNRRSTQITQLGQRWAQDIESELRGEEAKARGEVMKRIKESVTEVATKQGYSIVFDTNVAPYAANDITTDTLKSVNAKK